MVLLYYKHRDSQWVEVPIDHQRSGRTGIISRVFVKKKGGSSSGGGISLFDGVLHEIGDIPNVQLVHDIGPVGVNGLAAQRKLGGCFPG